MEQNKSEVVIKPNYFDSLFYSSIDSSCDLKVAENPPKWLDKDLYLEGNKFFWDHVLIVFLVYCQNLIVGLSVPNLCYPLVLTEKSETVGKAFRRYVHTGVFILQLYSDLPWDQNSTIQRVNKYHSSAADKIRQKSKQDVLEAVDKIFRQLPPKQILPTHKLDQVLMTNLRKVSAEMNKSDFQHFELYSQSKLVFSNFDMALVQSAFFASILLYPEQCACKHVTEKQLEGLAHVWRVMGYYLGLPDTSNFVTDSLDQTKETLKQMYTKIFVPALLKTDQVSLIMGKNVAKATGINYHLMMYQTLRRHGIELEDLWKQFSFGHRVLFYLTFLLLWLYSFSVIRSCLNHAFMIIAKFFFIKGTHFTLKL